MTNGTGINLLRRPFLSNGFLWSTVWFANGILLYGFPFRKKKYWPCGLGGKLPMSVSVPQIQSSWHGPANVQASAQSPLLNLYPHVPGTLIPGQERNLLHGRVLMSPVS